MTTLTCTVSLHRENCGDPIYLNWKGALATSFEEWLPISGHARVYSKPMPDGRKALVVRGPFQLHEATLLEYEMLCTRNHKRSREPNEVIVWSP